MSDKENDRPARDIEHLRCERCWTNPTVAMINGSEHLVCHCTHADGDVDPVELHGFDSLPDPWVFRTNGGEPDAR